MAQNKSPRIMACCRELNVWLRIYGREESSMSRYMARSSNDVREERRERKGRDHRIEQRQVVIPKRLASTRGRSGSAARTPIRFLEIRLLFRAQLAQECTQRAGPKRCRGQRGVEDNAAPPVHRLVSAVLALQR